MIVIYPTSKLEWSYL